MNSKTLIVKTALEGNFGNRIRAVFQQGACIMLEEYQSDRTGRTTLVSSYFMILVTLLSHRALLKNVFNIYPVPVRCQVKDMQRKAAQE